MRVKAIQTGALLLLLLLLAGCAGQGGSVSASVQSAPTEVQSAPAEVQSVPAEVQSAPAAVQTAAPAETAPPEVTAAPAPSPTSAPSPTPDALTLSLEQVRGMIAEGRNYAAFQELLALEESCRGDAEGTARCEALFDELDRHLREIEPASGTELARSFTVQGGCVLEINAFSGPVLVAVSDAMAEPGTVPNSVRFYVRQGELGSIHLPAGTYYVGYQVGYRWFGDTDGFGEYYTEGTLSEPLVFDFYMDGAWASNAKFSITL